LGQAAKNGYPAPIVNSKERRSLGALDPHSHASSINSAPSRCRCLGGNSLFGVPKEAGSESVARLMEGATTISGAALLTSSKAWRKIGFALQLSGTPWSSNVM
jgi:hypothetical protein